MEQYWIKRCYSACHEFNIDEIEAEKDKETTIE